LGFLLLPFQSACSCLWSCYHLEKIPLHLLCEWFWLIKFNALIAYPITIIFGIPIYLGLQKFHQQKYRNYVLAAIFFGGVLSVTLWFLPKLNTQYSADIAAVFSVGVVNFVILSLLSLICVSVFWIIVRPDRQFLTNT